MAQLSTETEMKYILDRSSASTIFAPYARLLLSQGHVHEARTMAERGVLANPRYVMGHLVLAEAFKAEHDYRQALTQLMIALRLEPTHFESLQLAYQIFKLSHEKTAAAGVLQLIYRVNPSSKLATKNARADYGMTIKEILSKVEEVHATQMQHEVAGLPMVMDTMLDVEETDLRDVAIDLPTPASHTQDATIMDTDEDDGADLPVDFSIHDTVTEEAELYVTPSVESAPVNLTQAVPTNFSISLDPDDDGDSDVTFYHDEDNENAVSLSDIASHLQEPDEEVAPVTSQSTSSRNMDATISMNDDIFALPDETAPQEESAPSAITLEQPRDIDATISLNDDIFAQPLNEELSEAFDEKAFSEEEMLLNDEFSASLDELVGELHLHDEELVEDHDSYDHGLDDMLEPLEEMPTSTPIEALEPTAWQPEEVPAEDPTPAFSEEAMSFDDNEDPFADLRHELAESLTALGGTPTAAPVQPKEPVQDLIFNTVAPMEPVQPIVSPTTQFMDTPPTFETPASPQEQVEEFDDSDPFEDLRNELAESLTALGGTPEAEAPLPPTPSPVSQPEEPSMDLYFNAVAPPKAPNTMFPSRDLLLASDIVGDDDHHDEKTIAFAMPIMAPQAPVHQSEDFSTTTLLDDVGAAFDALSSDDPEATITLRTSETYQKAPDIFLAQAPLAPVEEAFAPDSWESTPVVAEEIFTPFQEMPEQNEPVAVQPQTLESAFSKLKDELSSYFETDTPEGAQPVSSQGELTPPEPFKPAYLGDDHLAEETYEMTTPLESLSFSTPAEVDEILSENNLESDEGISTESFATPLAISPKTVEPVRKIETEEQKESSAPTFSAESLPEHVITTTYADLYLQQDQPEMARSIYQRILEKNPDHDVAQQRLESLEKMLAQANEPLASQGELPQSQDHKPLAGKKIKVAIRKKLKGKELDE